MRLLGCRLPAVWVWIQLLLLLLGVLLLVMVRGLVVVRLTNRRARTILIRVRVGRLLLVMMRRWRRGLTIRDVLLSMQLVRVRRIGMLRAWL
jgi:hypothetical protein